MSEAEKWLDKASAQGHAQAQELLASIQEMTKKGSSGCMVISALLFVSLAVAVIGSAEMFELI